MCLIQEATGDATLEAKNGFRRGMMSRDITVKGYRADNGRDAKHTLKND